MIENSKNVGDKHPEYKFRRDLEQYISLYGKRMGSENEMVVGDLCVPSVVVVLEGGYGSLLKVSCNVIVIPSVKPELRYGPARGSGSPSNDYGLFGERLFEKINKYKLL